jgi:hypothetical protein
MRSASRIGEPGVWMNVVRVADEYVDVADTDRRQ